MEENDIKKLVATAERLGISAEQIPRHIALIMDGNGRWAKKRNLPRFEGHRQGAKIVEEIVQHCVDMGIECLTLYSFSMQNWKRPSAEVDFLMQLHSRYLVEIRPTLMRNNVKLAHLGSPGKLPEMVTDALQETISLTRDNTGMILAWALNYGSRSEIVRAVRQIARQCTQGSLEADDIDEQTIADNLYTASLPDPDLLIRTSNEMRISNFLLWQLSYAEFYVTETLWPDMEKSDIEKAILAYAKRSRRFGALESEVKSN